MNPNLEASITMDFTFSQGEITKDIEIVEQPNSGFAFDRVECRSAGAPLPNNRVSKLPSHEPGVASPFGPTRRSRAPSWGCRHDRSTEA
ncbi:MAG: hypothetical protein R2705_06635 [Ilumatobacteraceae bacterium]